VVWTQFGDMNSGGSQKEKFDKCYIEAPEEEAKSVFYSRFGHNPERVTCTCCGSDYSISESPSLEQASAYHRGCKWDDETRGYVEKSAGKSYSKYMTVEEYIESGHAHVIYAKDIEPHERHVDLPEQGYVWMG
jgi:hypothetical protein